jgi:hypothetical protein
MGSAAAMVSRVYAAHVKLAVPYENSAVAAGDETAEAEVYKRAPMNHPR